MWKVYGLLKHVYKHRNYVQMQLPLEFTRDIMLMDIYIENSCPCIVCGCIILGDNRIEN